jgi:DNA-directed RNA polymerase specialized sigma24 family protein
VREMVGYKFVTNALQDKLGVVKANVSVELTPRLIKEFAKREVRFSIDEYIDELIISCWDKEYKDDIESIIRNAAIEKIVKETKESDTIVRSFKVKLDVDDIDMHALDEAYRKEKEREKEKEQRKSMLAEIKSILKELEKHKLVTEFAESNDWVNATLIDGTEIRARVHYYDELEKALNTLKSLNREMMLLRAIEKWRKEIEELKKGKK